MLLQHNVFKPLLDRRHLSHSQWVERVRERRRQAATLPGFFKCGITRYSDEYTPWPIQLAYGLACDYTYDAAVRTTALLSGWFQDVKIVPYLTAQGLAEDYWNWLCQRKADENRSLLQQALDDARKAGFRITASKRFTG